jgi:hypothetical protein
MKEKVWDYLPEFVEALVEQLKKDDARWGDTWKHRVALGQEQRIFTEYTNYWDQYKRAGVPIPWLKVAGNALIAWIRDQSPDEFQEE